MIDLNDFHQTLDTARDFPLDGNQRQAVDFSIAPG